MAGQPRSHTVSNRLYCVAFVILLVAGIGAGALPPSKPTQAIPQLIPAALSAEPNAHTCSRFGQMGGLTPIFSPGEVRVSVRIEARCRAVFRTAQATCTPHAHRPQSCTALVVQRARQSAPSQEPSSWFKP